jgi:hypothetical protein
VEAVQDGPQAWHLRRDQEAEPGAGDWTINSFCKGCPDRAGRDLLIFHLFFIAYPSNRRGSAIGPKFGINGVNVRTRIFGDFAKFSAKKWRFSRKSMLCSSLAFVISAGSYQGPDERAALRRLGRVQAAQEEGPPHEGCPLSTPARRGGPEKSEFLCV